MELHETVHCTDNPRRCSWSGPLELTEVGGMDEGYVLCPACSSWIWIGEGMPPLFTEDEFADPPEWRQT